MRVAKDKLGARLQAKVGPEDVVQSALKSFFRRQGEFKFTGDGSDGLWGLLVVITIRKCAKWADVFYAQKRAAGREVSLAVGSEDGSRWLDVAGREPDPDEAAALSELVQQLLTSFQPRQQEMISLRMQGYEVEEIAERVQSSRRTVARVIADAKERLRSLMRSEPDS